MQARYVLHDQGMSADRVAIPLRRDPPDLHLPDAVLRHDPPPRQPPIPRLLPPPQLAPRRPLRRRLQPGPDVPRIPRPLHPGRATHPGRVVDLLIVDLARERARDRGDPHPPRLGPRPRLLLPAHHHYLGLQRVPLLLARVVPPLAPSRPSGRPLRGVEKKLADVLLGQRDLALGDAEDALQQR